MEPELPFEFYIQGTPVSLQASARSKTNWKNRLKRVIRTKLPEQVWLLQEPVRVELLLFLDTEMQGDLDNILKPILDSLEGEIIVNDRLVEEILIKKYEPERIIDLIDPSETLIEAQQSDRPTLYVKVERP